MTATIASPRTREADDDAEGGSTAVDRFRGRWRVALRYGARDARRTKGRTALVAAMVLLPVALGTFVSTVMWSTRQTPERVAYADLGPELQAIALSSGATRVDQAPDARGWGGGPESAEGVSLDELDTALREAMPAGAPVTTGLQAYVTASGDSLLRNVTALQLDVTAPGVAETFTLADGRLPGPGEVAMDPGIAEDLGLSLGDTVDLALGLTSSPGTSSSSLGTATVSGLLSTSVHGVSALLPAGGPLSAPDALFSAPDGVTPLWLVAGDAPVTWADVRTANEAGIVVSSRAVILDPPPDSEVSPVVLGGGPGGDELLRTWGVFGAVVVVALLEAVLLIGPAFAVGARRSARSLALVAASGGSARTVRAMVLGSGVAIGTVASVAGVVLGLAGAAILVAARDGLRWLTVPWPIVAGILLVGVLLAVAGAWVPARGAAKADVVAVLAGRRGEAAPRRRTAVIGAAVALGGYALAVVGGFTAQILVLLAGVLVGQLGVVLASGGIVTLLGRVAGGLSLSWRLALRDAARHRGRTSPAVAAVIVATAGATAGLVYSAAQADHDYRSQGTSAAPGVVVLADTRIGEGATGLTDDDVAAVREIVRDVLPEVGELLPVTALAQPVDDGVTTTFVLDQPSLGIGFMSSGMTISGPIVDDGTLVDALGFTGADADAAREALAAGRAVVQTGSLFDDGTAHYYLQRWGADAGTETEAPREGRLPATEVGDVRGPFNANLPLVPAALVDEIGLPVQVNGLISAEPASLSMAQVSTLSAHLAERFGTAEWGDSVVSVSLGEEPYSYGSPDWLATLLILGAGLLLALAAAWIAAALAATESRPDLATLTAVGSPPSTRKRVVAAQAGTITVIGVVIGVASGVALGAAFVMNERFRYDQVDPTWEFAVPWLPVAALLVVLPLLAITAAWLVTRSRLTLTRRLAT